MNFFHCLIYTYPLGRLRMNHSLKNKSFGFIGLALRPLVNINAYKSASKHFEQILLLSSIIFLLITIVGCSESKESNGIFENITLTSGLGGYKGMTHGVAWGDYDGDGLPDIYVTNHLNSAELFKNLGNGRFENTTQKMFAPEETGGDKHGASWADFDNNGTLDLVQLTGAIMGVGSEPKKLFVNNGERFIESAKALGVSNPLGRTRMPLWIDLNGDGLLDLFHGAEARFDDKRPPFVFIQQEGHFIESTEALPFTSKSVLFCLITELNGDYHSELICRLSEVHGTTQVFNTSTSPAQTLDILPVTAFEDIAAADFDNDGKIDIFMARKNPAGPIAFGHPGSNELTTDLTIASADFDKQAGFNFQTEGHLDFRVDSQYSTEKLTPEHIFIGTKGLHPDSLEFTLSRETAHVKGIATYKPGQQTGVFIGQTESGLWPVFVSGAPKTPLGAEYKQVQVALSIKSTQPITDIKAAGFTVVEEKAPARLFMNRDGRFIEESEQRGVNKSLVAGVNVVAGDFDNDMNIDLFVLGSGDVGKEENLMLLNRGDGRFKVVASAGGAQGSSIGVGDSVTMVDFDQDGFLDLFFATGASMGRSLGFPSEKGGYTLYRNKGNGNHWLEIDLEGTVSNRNAIGAIVKLTVNGITQTRVQDGGMHHRGQNHSRLHFGLAKNNVIEKLSIQWPSGKHQELSNIPSNQIIKIIEPAA